MTEQSIGKRSRLRSRAEADALAAEYEASGLGRQEFCRQRNVAFKTLARYLAQRRKRADVRTHRFLTHRVQVEPLPEAVSELAVTLAGGRRIVVKPGFDADLLRQLLTVLEQA